MKVFGWSPEFIDWELDGVQGFAYSNWARENEVSLWGGGEERKSPGYVKAEFNKLMKEYRESKK